MATKIARDRRKVSARVAEVKRPQFALLLAELPLSEKLLGYFALRSRFARLECLWLRNQNQADKLLL